MGAEQNENLLGNLVLVEQSLNSLNKIKNILNESNLLLSNSIKERNNQRDMETRARSSLFRIVYERLFTLIIPRVITRAFLADSNIDYSLSVLIEIDSLLLASSMLYEVVSEDSKFAGWNAFHEQTRFTIIQIQ